MNFDENLPLKMRIEFLKTLQTLFEILENLTFNFKMIYNNMFNYLNEHKLA